LLGPAESQEQILGVPATNRLAWLLAKNRKEHPGSRVRLIQA